MKKLILLALVLLPTLGFTATLDSILLGRNTGYAPYEDLKIEYNLKCVEPRLKYEREMAIAVQNPNGMFGGASQHEIERISLEYARTRDACDSVVDAMNVAYAEFRAQESAAATQDTSAQIADLEAQIRQLQMILNLLLQLQGLRAV
jgi:hypothetical protein